MILIPSLFLRPVESCYLSTSTNACSSTYLKEKDGDAVVICGSTGEVANDPLTRNTFTHDECKFNQYIYVSKDG